MKIIKKICPICALVSVTWLTLLTLKGLGFQVNETLLAMLMGGSVVGVSYSLSKKIKGSEMWWKLLSVPLGFGLMFALSNFAWANFIAMTVAYSLLWLLFRQSSGSQLSNPESGRKTDINNQLKNCC